ncbi:MAG: hypothetical protein HC905_16515 [Bacteroidales bacterium]|nr:hypothetical protein [Bacteroidales bacterium]
MGVYVLMEKIKQGVNRVNIANLKPEDISGKSLTGGYIFKIDKTTGVNNEGWISQYKTKSGGEITLLYHDPKPDEMQIHKKPISNFL